MKENEKYKKAICKKKKKQILGYKLVEKSFREVNLWTWKEV